ncbi:glycosyltransferase [Thalassolituus maritimus]|uniref:Rhamnosyl transferase n=1 Tax=Thalassolituus maritimus TaxID=484498 RepID=A0ABQ0A277_9GAMM
MKRVGDVDVFHVIFTRFNVKSGGKERQLREQREWLKGRYELFDRYCFPAVKGQSDTNFQWLVFFDVNTPDEYKKRNEEYKLTFPNFNPVYVSEWNSDVIRTAIFALTPEGTEWLISTRLDNDDGIHEDFIRELKACEFEEAAYFNYPNGLTFSNGKGYKHFDDSNAFLSYIESITDVEGVWKYPHPEVIKRFPVTQLKLDNAWLQVIHGGNVSNKVRGDLADFKIWRSAYPFMSTDDVAKLNPVIRFIDSTVLSNFRNGRDYLIRAVKGLISR